MALLLRLEDFETDHAGQDGPDQHTLAALPGYDAGFAAGQVAALSDQKHVDAALVQTLSDMAFGFAEARQHTLAGMTPLFAALIDQLIPRVVEESFRARLLETLSDLAGKSIAGPTRLIVHPDQIDAVSAILPMVNGLSIDLHHDPEIGAHGALISQNTAEFVLDIDDLVQQINSILSTMFDMTTPQKEQSKNG